MKHFFFICELWELIITFLGSTNAEKTNLNFMRDRYLIALDLVGTLR